MYKFIKMYVSLIYNYIFIVKLIIEINCIYFNSINVYICICIYKYVKICKFIYWIVVVR